MDRRLCCTRISNCIFDIITDACDLLLGKQACRDGLLVEGDSGTLNYD